MRRSLFLLLCTPLGLLAQSAAVLEGDVVNTATNAPITNARVILSRQSESRHAKVDSQGHFVMASLTPGSYQLTVDNPGFFPLHSMVDLGASAGRSGARAAGAAPLKNSDGLKFERSIDAEGVIRGTVNVPLTPQAVIAGKVTDPYGLPIYSCTIEVLTKPTEGMSVRPGMTMIHRAQVETDDRGEFRVFGLPAGTYWVVANKGIGSFGQTWESSHRITYYPSATSIDDAQPLTLAAGQTLQADIQIVRLPGVRVGGKVIKPPGVVESVVGITGVAPTALLYTNIALVPRGSVLTNSNGPFTSGTEDFEFKDVMPGKYTLMALTRDASSDRFGPNQKAVAGLTREVEIGAQDMPGFDLTLEQLRDLAGEVTFAEGCKAAPLEIRAAANGPIHGDQVKTTSGPDGKFVLAGVTAGRFEVQVLWPRLDRPYYKLVSIRLGDRDVDAKGLDAPYSGKEPLRIAIDCYNNGRQK